MRFISLEEVLGIHDLMLEIAGGRAGLHDFTLLHSAVERPKAHFGGEHLYATIWLAAAALMQSLVKNHPFEDGNKRTAYFSTMRFLHKNGYVLSPQDQEVLEFMVAVDVERKSVEEIATWLQKHAAHRLALSAISKSRKPRL